MTFTLSHYSAVYFVIAVNLYQFYKMSQNIVSSSDSNNSVHNSSNNEKIHSIFLVIGTIMVIGALIGLYWGFKVTTARLTSDDRNKRAPVIVRRYSKIVVMNRYGQNGRRKSVAN